MKENRVLLCDEENFSDVCSLSAEFPDMCIQPLHFDADKKISADCVAVFLAYSSVLGGPKKHEADFFRRNEDVKRWVIVITRREGAYAPTLSKWRQLGMELAVPADIIMQETLSGAVQALHEILKKDIRKCLIGYARNKDLAEDFVGLLARSIPGWEFEAVPGERLGDCFQTAAKLILLGQDPRDFQFKKVEIDANKDLTVVYHCPGCVYEPYYEGQCLISLAALRREGWEISDAFSAYLLSNIKYECARGAAGSSAGMGAAAGGEKLQVLWDAYGLPRRADEMSETERAVFWEQFQAARRIGCWLNK